ncbi:MAG: DNA-binding domain-containing protein [Pygmaiobacter sp.]
MRFYIIEDDFSVMSNLEDIIATYNLGVVCGEAGDAVIDTREIIAANPDIVLVDFLMPDKDGINVVRELRSARCDAKCIMLSQLSTKALIAKAYDAGIDFFISKPLNVIEVRAVIGNVIRQIETERTLADIRRMCGEVAFAAPAKPYSAQENDLPALRKVQNILNQLGMSGEKGSEDIVRIIQYLLEHHLPAVNTSVSALCEKLSDSPKNMEQRIRRAISVGMSNIAHLGIEDFLSESFKRDSRTLFTVLEVCAEMDIIRGGRPRRGKNFIKKII